MCGCSPKKTKNKKQNKTTTKKNKERKKKKKENSYISPNIICNCSAIAIKTGCACVCMCTRACVYMYKCVYTIQDNPKIMEKSNWSKIINAGVPTMVQWVKNLTAVAQVALEVWVWSPAQHSGLKIWHHCGCGIDCSCGSDSFPGPGTSIYCGCGHLKKNQE